MNMEEYLKNGRLLEGEYKILGKMYPKSLLDGFFANLKIFPDDYILMDRVYEQLSANMKTISDDILREATLICVMGNDEGDAEFIKNNPDCCQQCGWCCKNCDPIIVRPDEIPKIGSTKNVKLFVKKGHKNAYAIKLPCNYQLKDNSCGIYNRRPDSCKIFPIGYKNGKSTVQRSIHCGFIEFFLVNKTAYFVNLVHEKMNK